MAAYRTSCPVCRFCEDEMKKQKINKIETPISYEALDMKEPYGPRRDY